METESMKLDHTMFDLNDMLRFVLQRSEILYDVEKPGRLIKKWTEGDEEPLKKVVQDKQGEIFNRVFADISKEFDEIHAVLSANPPKSITDIGCGYALFDCLAAKAYGSKVTLIDTESNDRRHFGFESDGAAYSDLDKAVRFLTCNGVAQDRIKAVNPTKYDIKTLKKADLAVSFLACGFHFPVSAYMDFFRNNLKKSGRIILDLRRSKYEVQREALLSLGSVNVLKESGNRLRVLVDKSDMAR